MEEKNLQDLLMDAKAGDLEAQFVLGMRSRTGKGLKYNRKETAKWWQPAAEQGQAEAMTHLGLAYILGRGVAKDEAQGVKWWQLAADQADPQAQLLLGRYYLRDGGTEQDKAEALRLLKLAAEQGSESARLLVGQMYYEGNGVEQDPAEAIKWFDGNAWWMGKCYLHGCGVERNVEKTIELWESVAKDSYTMYMELAHLYSDGIHMTPNHKKAERWWREACTDDQENPTRGVPEAMYELACSYYKGRGVRKDRQMALNCFKWAIKSYERYEKAYGIEPGEKQKYFDAYRMAILLGNKAVIRKLRTLARNGETAAETVLEEFGISWKRAGSAIMLTPVASEKSQPIPVAVGETIWHITWGEGVVYQVDEEFVWVEFAEVGKKSFVNPDAFDEGCLSKEPI